MCKFSIVVPVYNTELYLHRCLDSIVNQSFSDFEVLLIDDGSTDGSGKICDFYAEKDSRIRVFHKENGGVSSARNLGLQEARGAWVCFVDSDDIIIENALGILMSQIQKNTDYVMCGYEVFDEDNQCVYSVSKQKQCVVNQHDALVEMFAPTDYRYQGYLWNKLFKASVIRDNKIVFAEKIKFNEDRLFNVEYLCHCKGDISYSLIPVYRYIEHSTGAMASLTQYYNPSFLTDLDAFVRMGDLLRGILKCKDVLDVHADSMYYSVGRYYTMCRQFGHISIPIIWNVERRFLKGVGVKRYLCCKKNKLYRKIQKLCKNS